MAQNTSHAVMAQRAKAEDALDFFPTPPWATRALCEHVIDIRRRGVWEPACGAGHMAGPLREYASAVIATDVHDYGFPFTHKCDFLFPGTPIDCDWIITNPPFLLAEKFIHKAADIARCGVALLVRTSFLEGTARNRNIFSKMEPSIIAQFSERVIMAKGVCRDPSKKYWNETKQRWQKPSTATAYCWVIWENEPRVGGCRFMWIPPCRKQLERAGDYDH